ncbi:MAG: HEAT repeat domain-containing protein [candidate division WOR-3 bacterium]
MQQSVILDFLKELSVGFKSAKSYPPGHPVMEKVVTNTIAQLSRVFADYAEFSFYFMEKTVIFQDIRIDVSKSLAILSFIEALRKNEIESLTFYTGVSNDDMKNLYEVMSSSKLKIKEYGDAATMLQSKGTEKIRINAVKFGIQTGATAQVAQVSQGVSTAIDAAEVTRLIDNFRRLVEKGIALVEAKVEFDKIIVGGEKMPGESQTTHSSSVAEILENLSYDQRIALLKDIEFKPFILKILANFSEEKLLEIILARTNETGEIKKILGALNEDKFSKLLPLLKEKIPNIYEYLAQMGLMLNEKITSLFSRDDLDSTIRPYYNMLYSQNARVREEGLKSLTTLADRFIRQDQIELAGEIAQRLSVSFEQEPVPEVISNSLEQIYSLYNTAYSANQNKICDVIIEPFNRILGRQGISLQFKKAIINFMGETRNPKILPALISFLWETGLYPEVRAAIIKFGKESVSELLLTLREAEDYSLRMKIVDILKNIGSDAVEILLNNIDTPEWYLRRNILIILGEIATKEICPRLENLLIDLDDRVRLELARTFIKLDYEPGLRLLLKDSATEVRAEALHGLRKSISVKELTELLPAFKEKGDALHAELLKIIAEKQAKEAFSTIVDYLKGMELRDDQTAQELKQLALSTLIKLSHPEMKTVLAEFANSRDRFTANLSQSMLKKLT